MHYDHNTCILTIYTALVTIVHIYEYEYEWRLLFYSLGRTSLNDKSLPYVNGLNLVTPY